MSANGLSYTGTDNVNTSTKDNATDIGIPSSGSSVNAEVIWIILMLIVLLIVLPRMKEFMEFIFATDNTSALEEIKEKTDSGEAHDGDGA
mmetsp:Transcript_12101/g.22208  ORF Transcript_12101/g.22208 Transcript_12101/m.22208 type:complete len:90 (+) Transcript_12101:68-337(+)